jgi:hypothetical protein
MDAVLCAQARAEGGRRPGRDGLSQHASARRGQEEAVSDDDPGFKVVKLGRGRDHGAKDGDDPGRVESVIMADSGSTHMAEDETHETARAGSREPRQLRADLEWARAARAIVG